jgi:cytochrome c peroxidase
MRKSLRSCLQTAVAVIAFSPFLAAVAFAQTTPDFRGGRGAKDPGVRGGTPGAGCFLDGLGTTEQQFFLAAGRRFAEVDSVSGNAGDAAANPGLPAGGMTGTLTLCPNTTPVTTPLLDGSGLGTGFNMNICAGCHAQPAVGGSSPGLNPQVRVATLDGATNTVPSFIRANGPVRETRFVKYPDGTADGGVHNLFEITGRKDATGCRASQPNYEQAVQQNNVIFRIPAPVFGAGQIENTSDETMEHDSATVASQQHANGIASGVFNHNGNDGTITRFGWKAQNKSLLIFSGEAYNVEQGVTNENFPNERDETPGCQFNAQPEDATNLVNPNATGVASSDFSSDIVNFAGFMRLLAGPKPAAATASTTAGQAAFNEVGCSLCHIQNHKTSSSIFSNQGNVTFSPFSDVALHEMGQGLADNVSQGGADGTQFRSAPLWGVGQRIFFLHDGRTADLLQAIEQHKSEGSEADTVIGNFNALSDRDQQNILNFLRSL